MDSKGHASKTGVLRCHQQKELSLLDVGFDFLSEFLTREMADERVIDKGCGV